MPGPPLPERYWECTNPACKGPDGKARRTLIRRLRCLFCAANLKEVKSTLTDRDKPPVQTVTTSTPPGAVPTAAPGPGNPLYSHPVSHATDPPDPDCPCDVLNTTAYTTCTVSVKSTGEVVDVYLFDWSG